LPAEREKQGGGKRERMIVILQVADEKKRKTHP